MVAKVLNNLVNNTHYISPESVQEKMQFEH